MNLIPKFEDKRFAASFVIPVAISLISAVFKVNFLVSFLISLLDVMAFWLVIVLVVGLITQLKKEKIDGRWKILAFSMNLLLLPLLLTELVQPLLEGARDATFSGGNDWGAMEALDASLAHKTLVMMPLLMPIIAYGLIILLLALAIIQTQHVHPLKSLFISLVAVLLGYFLGMILAGLPLSLL